MTFLFPYLIKLINKYSRKKEDRKAFYGLPKQVKFCKSCVISNQRPSSTIEFKNDGTKPKQVINFNSDGICDACLVRQKIDEIDWIEREKILREICDKHRRNDGRSQ